MTKTIFGGDHSMSHFNASFHSDHRLPSKERSAIAKEMRDKLKAVGFPERYFRYKDKDLVAKAKAKADCEKFADEWMKKSGVKLTVSEGFFL